MKQTSRKLLSLLMAFAIMLSFVPTALADDPVTPATPLAATITVNKTVSLTNNSATVSPTVALNSTADGFSIKTYSWSVSGGTGAFVSNGHDTASPTITFTQNGTFTIKVEGKAEKTGSDGTKEEKTYSAEATGIGVTGYVADTISFTGTSASELIYGSGTSIGLEVTVTSANTNAQVDWSSSNPSLVTVSVAGGNDRKATVMIASAASAPATATDVTITATIKGSNVKAEKAITVKPAAAPSITLTSAASSVTMGRTLGLTATPQNAPTGYTIAWDISNVSDEGGGNVSVGVGANSFIFTPSRVGKVTISAILKDSQGKKVAESSTIEITVTSATSSVVATLTAPTQAVTVNGNVNVTLNVTSGAANVKKLEWTVNNGAERTVCPETLTLYAGSTSGSAQATFKIKQTGTTTITVKMYGVNDVFLGEETCYVSTNTAVYLSGGSNLNLTRNTSGTMTVYVSGLTDWSDYTIRWSSSNPNIAYFSNNGSSSTTSTLSIYGTSSTARYSSVTVYSGSTAGTANITITLYKGNTAVEHITRTVTVSGSVLTLTPNPSNSGTVYLNQSGTGTSGGYYYRDFSVTPYMGGSAVSSSYYDVVYTWSLNGYTVQNGASTYNNSSTYRLASNEWYFQSGANTLTCTVYVYNKNSTHNNTNLIASNDVSWTVYATGTSGYDISVSATVYDSNPGYALSDTPDEGTSSIASQIDSQVSSWIRNHYSYNSYRDYTVQFSGGTAYESGSSGNKGYLSSGNSWYYSSELNKVVFTPNSSVTTANGSYKISYTFDVRVYVSNSSSYEIIHGVMTFTVKQGTASGGDITYSAELGRNVAFDVNDFEDFWYRLYNRGTLSYVTFGTVSGGTVYTEAGKAVGSTGYYVNPTRNQADLSGVYFAPNSTTSRTATTVRIPFTANGTTGSGTSTTSRSGVIVITYLSAAAKAITVSTNANGVATLKAQDFIDAYKAAVNTSTTPSNLTIRFQNVPSYGTLTYKDSSKSSSSDVRLTSSNIKNYSFTTKTTGSDQLGDVTYTASSSRTETISYIGYIGNTATFSGEVTFNAVTAPTNVQVTLPTCYTTAGTTLSSSLFTNANTALLNASYVVLGTPRLGTLKSSVGPTTSAIQMSSLAYVSYVPNGTNGTDSFSFTAYNSSAQIVASGTVTVVVALPATTGSITNINQFSDIPAAGGTADWYRTQLTYLISKGMINGKGNGKFGPEEDLEYSEALKFIMNAAGIVESESTTAGTNWAQNYKNTAVQKGWMSSTVDLTKPITRDAMAELTAKVLGIPAGTGASPFSDSSNAWAIALYNAKIVIGSDNSSKPAFLGSDNLTRAQMVVLVYRMYQYSGK